jgi:serine/threonine protein kinase
MVGTVLAGRYLIETLIGEGGMGRVYAASDQQLHRRVAIKLVREELKDPAAHDRFMREARAAASLTHGNACRLYEVGEHEGQNYLVMELLEGESLSARLSRGHLDLEEALAIILPLMGAVAALHEAGLVHRDLKPSNVFLTAQGVKLLDFGLARHTRAEEAVTAPTLTAPGAVTGTLRYMAPEQVTGDPVDRRTDTFALAVILYEMLTGKIPFNATTNVDWLNAVLKDDPSPLGRPELAALEPVLQRALQRRPEDRFQTVAEMSAALQGALDGTAAPSSPVVPAAEPEQREKDETEDDERISVVVLPFRSLKEDPEIEFLQDSVPEMLTASLSENPTLRVLSNRAAQHFDANVELATIGRELGVERLITGTFLRADNQVRVTVQLVAATDGCVEWSHASQYAFENALALQDEICAGILSNLRIPVEEVPTASST